jgi:hypothetical protein
VFCNQLSTHANPLMHQLVYEPDQAMQNMLNRFIQEYVFFEEEDGKRIFECGLNEYVIIANKKNLMKFIS